MGSLLGAERIWAAFRIACSAPVKRLLRRRPREALRDLEGPGVDLATVIAPLSAFVRDAEVARMTLAGLEPGFGGARDPWTHAVHDVEALSKVYSAVVQRLEIVRVRVAAVGEMDAVTRAAGEVSLRARSSGLDPADLSDLVGEVTRAELAIAAAPPDDPRDDALAQALARSAVTMEPDTGASIDDLLQAMRELS